MSSDGRYEVWLSVTIRGRDIPGSSERDAVRNLRQRVEELIHADDHLGFEGATVGEASGPHAPFDREAGDGGR